MKIEVGEYIRTFNGEIAKIIGTSIEFDTKVYTTDQYIQSSRDFYVFENDCGITKHSKSIIDLIEVGDYVNGKKVLQKIGKFLEVSSCDIGNNRIYDYMIKSIVTKQQFSNMEYRL